MSGGAYSLEELVAIGASVYIAEPSVDEPCDRCPAVAHVRRPGGRLCVVCHEELLASDTGYVALAKERYREWLRAVEAVYEAEGSPPATAVFDAALEQLASREVDRLLGMLRARAPMPEPPAESQPVATRTTTVSRRSRGVGSMSCRLVPAERCRSRRCRRPSTWLLTGPPQRRTSRTR